MAKVALNLRLPLHTFGRFFVDASGQRVRLQCVNWYGAHLEHMVQGGLDRLALENISTAISSAGFNCVRLSFNLEMVFNSTAVVFQPQVTLAANPDLTNLSATPFDLFDRSVASLTDRGLMVILNNHISSPGWCCTSEDGEGLWYTTRYNEDMWLNALGEVASRYHNNLLVVGFDLRNEIRGSQLGNPTWGYGDEPFDWSVAAVKGARRVLENNPNMLILVSGLEYSKYLCDVPGTPIHLLPDLYGRLAYTVHAYSWERVLGPEASEAVWNLQLILIVFCLGLTSLVFFSFVVSQLRQLRWCKERETKLCQFQLGQRLYQSFLDFQLLLIPRRNSCFSRACNFCFASLVLALLIALTCWHVEPCEKDIWTRRFRAFQPLFSLVLGNLSLLLWLRLFLAETLSRGRRCVQAAVTVSESHDDAEGSVNLEDDDCNCSQPNGSTAELQPHFEQTSSTSGPSRSPTQGQLSTCRPFSSSKYAGGCKRLCDCTARSKVFLLVVMSAATLVTVAIVWHDMLSYEAFKSELDMDWGFLLDDVAAANAGKRHGRENLQAVPVWLGEFGTDYDSRWWRYMLRYIQDYDLDWSYWAFNGEKRVGEDESFGLMDRDWVKVRHEWKLEHLQMLINRTTSF